MTLSIHGVGVSRGIAIGKIHIVERDQLDITEDAIDTKDIAAEIQRLETALTQARQQLRAVRDHIPHDTSDDIAAFIDTHLLMLEDAAFTDEPVRLITELSCNAEWALKLQRDALVAVFDEMEDAYLRTRRDDVDHVVNRIQRILLNQKPLKHEVLDSRLRGYIVLAADLAPADTVLMQHHGIGAFVTEYGGPTSHTAILARSLEIPSIVGAHHAQRYIREDELVIVDGSLGVVIVAPDDRILALYRAKQAVERQYLADLLQLRSAPAITRDAVEVELHANIELPTDVDAALKYGASGVGLYRTEYLFMNRKEPPEENEQYETYVGALKSLQGIPLTIRTLDLGADKQVDGGRADGPLATNPALGLRAVRLCLKEPELFNPQLRAIIRASAAGPVRLMIPMLSNIHELQQVLAIVTHIQDEFRDRAVDFDPNMPIGGMIEVPAAALSADVFARHLDFMSIGTNDLIQYTIAIDRVNDEVNYLYDPLHPSVLRLVRMTIEAGIRANIPVAMCGEMAGDPLYIRLLLALGLREFSVHPAALLEVKRIVNETNVGALTEFSQRLLNSSSGVEVLEMLSGIN